MAICADFGRVFEIGPVFRAEDSFTHRHLCEFTGLDLEMEIKEHYFEVLDILDKLFVAIFDGLNENCKKELHAINQQYPFEPLKYVRKTLRLTFPEGIQMLKVEIHVRKVYCVSKFQPTLPINFEDATRSEKGSQGHCYIGKSCSYITTVFLVCFVQSIH